jgi:hypothetical protein
LNSYHHHKQLYNRYPLQVLHHFSQHASISYHNPLYVMSSSSICHVIIYQPSIYVFNWISVANSIYLWVPYHKFPAVEIHVGSIILKRFTLNKITWFHI